MKSNKKVGTIGTILSIVCLAGVGLTLSILGIAGIELLWIDSSLTSTTLSINKELGCTVAVLLALAVFGWILRMIFVTAPAYKTNKLMFAIDIACAIFIVAAFIGFCLPHGLEMTAIEGSTVPPRMTAALNMLMFGTGLAIASAITSTVIGFKSGK